MYTVLHAAVGRESAVHGDADAGDETGGLVVHQEQQSAVQLFGLSEAAHGGAGQNLMGTGSGRAVLVPQQLCILLAGEETGGNGIDTDIHPGEVNCQPLGKVGYRGFRAGVSRDLGQGGIGIHGRNIDDITAAAADHVLGECLGGNQGAVEVQTQNQIHAVIVQIEEGFYILTVQIAFLVIFLVGG